MSTYVGKYIKSCSWFIHPDYAYLAILLHINSSSLSHVQYRWKCKLSYLFLYPFFVILVAPLKVSQLSSFPCWYLWYLWCVCGWSPWMYNKIKLSLWPCYQAKILIGILHDFVLDIMLFLVYLFCVCMFLCGEISLWYCPLRETYTHKRWYISIWYLIYLLRVDWSC